MATTNSTLPADDNNSLYHYEPSLAAALIFVALFLIITVIHTYQLIRTKTWYFIPFMIGGHLQWVGYIGRVIGSREDFGEYTTGPYIMQALCLLLAPAFYAASIYMVLGRIILLTEGERHSIIRAKWLTKIFVLGDVLSFVMQGLGGGLLAGDDPDRAKLGRNIILAGLGVQVVFFSFFMVTASIFHLRMRKVPTTKILASPMPWQKHLFTLYAGSLLILIRSIFRLIEYGQGQDGYLMSHEVYLYVFDSILMLATMVLFAVIHPSEVTALRRGPGGKAVKNLVHVYEMI